MNKKRTLLPQKLGAGFLLALFLFIHVVKLTHHHPSGQSFAKTTGSGKHFASNGDCSICDYHFVKDSHSEKASVQVALPLLALASYTEYLSHRLTSIGLSSSDRGPPAVA